MWTRRSRYIKEVHEFNDSPKSMGHFHDFIIGSFSFDSKPHIISLSIEEDYTNNDNTNSDALVWNLQCEGDCNFQMQDMDGLSRWWISEILFEDSTLHFQLVNGYFAFELQNLSFGIPNKPQTESDNVIQKINLDYLIKEVESGMSIEQISLP